jgi:hypothetical protein
MAQEKLFGDFVFSLLESEDFREDSVREELIAPLLRKLGYSASGENTIIRSKRLEHPFVSIGTTSHKISIIPDYLLQVKGASKWILDAKSPKEEIRRGRNVEQAFSYAIHREVRVQLYGLCNGREFILFHVSDLQPVLSFKLQEIEQHWDELYRAVSPLALTRPDLLDFRPDFGIALVKLGFLPTMTMHFPLVALYAFGRVSDELFTASSNVDIGEGPFAASFDFGRELFNKLLAILPARQSELLRKNLTRQPYLVQISREDPVIVHVRAKLGVTVQRNKDEAFVALQVEDFEAPET